MICPNCSVQNHTDCTSADCCCGHAGSSVRALTDGERQALRNGTLTGTVMPREAEDDR